MVHVMRPFMTRKEQIKELFKHYYHFCNYVNCHHNYYSRFFFIMPNEYLSKLSREYILDFARTRKLNVEFNENNIKFIGGKNV